MPPPVATGGKPSSILSPESEPVQQREPPQPAIISSSPTNQKPLREAPPPNAKPLHLTPPQKPTAAVSPGTPAISPLTPGHPDAQHSGEHIESCVCHNSAPQYVSHFTKQNSFFFCPVCVILECLSASAYFPPSRAQAGRVVQAEGV